MRLQIGKVLGGALAGRRHQWFAKLAKVEILGMLMVSFAVSAVGQITVPLQVTNVINTYAWGAGSENTGTAPHYGQSLVPTDLVGVKAIAAGGYQSLAVCSDGRVTAWGSDLGWRINLPPDLTNISAVAAGLTHSLALTSNGSVIAWEIDHGCVIYNYRSPATVPATATNVLAVAAGWYHSLALQSNGTVIAWGAGMEGDYMQGSLPCFRQCIVPTNLTGVSAIAAGAYHSLALRSNGTVVAWGYNLYGQTNVPAGLSNVVAIAAGASTSVALKSDGTVVAWGANDYGQTNIPAGLSNVVAVAAGASHVLALRNDGTMFAWGSNAYGQTNIPTDLTNVMAISVGAYHNLALKNLGPVSLLSQPRDQTIYAGANATFAVNCLGDAPLVFQWLKDGAIVPGGTNSSLTISNAQSLDKGTYQVSVSNAFGVVTSAAAVLTVWDDAPMFTVQPADTLVFEGSSVSMTGAVRGMPPLTYQWSFNGAALSGATNLSLTVSNAQLADRGVYSLTVSNMFGTANSSNVFLEVVDLPRALGATNLTWVQPEMPGWFAQGTNTHNGIAAAAIVFTNYKQVSTLETYVTGPGKLTFWWSGDWIVNMAFQVDDVVQTSQYCNNATDWRQVTIFVPAAVHKLTWAARCSSSSPKLAFLSEVTFTPGIEPVSFTSEPVSKAVGAGSNVTFNVAVTGAPSFSYQWYFNDRPIPFAESASLTLWNVQATNSGAYKVSVKNRSNSVTSSNAVLTVIPSAPVITGQPTGGHAMIGGSFTFSGVAIGTSPISYQWLLNNIPIPGATSAALTVSNVQSIAACNYNLVASNSVGVTISSNALLSVHSTDDLRAALDNPSLVWSVTNFAWFPQSTSSHDGVSAAQSSFVTNKQQSTLRTTVTGPAMVTYWWRVSCDSQSSFAFSANGTIQNFITGTTTWRQETNYIGLGTQVLEWKMNQWSDVFGGGTAWLDQVQVIPIAGASPTITGQSADVITNASGDVMLWVTATGTPFLRYQWQFNGFNLAGATNSTLYVYNVQETNAGTYTVIVSNDLGSMSSNCTLTVIPSAPSAPSLTYRPISRTNAVNTTAVFYVAAKGTFPMSYQWYFNDSAIAGANSDSLRLSAVQMSDAGNYSVVVSNALGSVSSSNAHLTVTPCQIMDFWPYNYDAKGYTAPANLGDVMAIAVGAKHTMALRADGSVLVWGDNSYGQTNVPAGLSNVVAIAAGNYRCLALKADGSLAAWGDYGFTQASVPAGLSNVVAIAAGLDFDLALKADGTVAAWGNDDHGQTEVPLTATNVRAVFAGYYNGFALRSDGSLIQWGDGPVWQHNGENAQLGLGAGVSNVTKMAVGSCSAWSLQNDGSVLAYGWYDGARPYTNVYGPNTSRGTGEATRSVYYNIAAIAAFGSSTPYEDYALLLGNDGRVTQIGNVSWGGSSSSPFISTTSTSPIAMSPSNVVAIAAGQGHAAALISDGLPRVSLPSFSRVAFTSETVVFSASASGRLPLQYQWQRDGLNIDFATNSTLVLTNVPLSAAGNYRCVVTNALGTATSSDVLLTVQRSALRLSSALKEGVVLQLHQLSGHGNVIIEASTNLENWVPVLTNSPAIGSFQFLDSGLTNHPARFYRALEE